MQRTRRYQDYHQSKNPITSICVIPEEAIHNALPDVMSHGLDDEVRHLAQESLCLRQSPCFTQSKQVETHVDALRSPWEEVAAHLFLRRLVHLEPLTTSEEFIN
jgi:hypothetical protein